MSAYPSGDGFQQAFETFVKALLGDGLPARLRQVARWTLVRMGAYELADQLCDFKTFGSWAIGSTDPHFLQQLPRIRSRDDRLELLEQHRRWGAWLEQTSAPEPIRLPAARKPGRLRLGLVSSSLANHVIGQFALPLFELRDSRFDLYAYSTTATEATPGLEHMKSRSIFRDLANLAPRAAAEIVAADDLDMLVELDGITGDHVLRVVAHRPARLQASWLGYPHSTGLSTIDYMILDPQLKTDLILEKPLTLPRTWLALPRYKYNDLIPLAPGTPEERAGYLTFGTLNNPYKYTVESLRTWAEIVGACPGSKFLFGRPEAGAPSFRRGMIKRFAAAGVGEDRLVFVAEQGLHMPIYDQIDISLDTYPITGGTTTADALWMGVPVVSLVGEGLSERLSYSMLVNAGLEDFAVGSVEQYKTAALALAANPARRRALRHTLRERLRSGPLGQPREFAQAFYDLMATTIQQTSAGAP